MITTVTTLHAAALRGVSTSNRNVEKNAIIQAANPNNSYTYNYMYPYLNNQMRTTLKPADASSPSTSPINAVVRTEQLSTPRRVVARPGAVRAATAVSNSATSARRVGARPGSARAATPDVYRPTDYRDNVTYRDNAIDVAASRGQLTDEQRNATIQTTYPAPAAVSSARCLADYTECMNRYCERADTKYNRCYCSAKLSQIDAEYQPQIESLITQIVALQSGGNAIDTNELNEYWAEMIAKDTGSNSWQNIDDALNIDWASMENRLRGQNAFITGHEYCSQHLSGCFYMASNLRDVYRSAIATDCADYESGLERLKLVAESVIQNYHE